MSWKTVLCLVCAFTVIDAREQTRIFTRSWEFKKDPSGVEEDVAAKYLAAEARPARIQTIPRVYSRRFSSSVSPTTILTLRFNITI